MWKLKDKANGKTKEENAIDMKKYEVSINIGSYRASFYDVGLISSFENKDEFWAYTKYPEHDEALEFIQSVQLDEQIVDYEHE
jgi:hypothetical protein